jgi:glycosylphosphatidylinositol transamidase (GPIT) subunit GPI8
MWHYEYENNSSTLLDKDGFPAQVLQAYYILRGHGYDDDHITLMLYHTNDGVIDIEGDGTNDLTNAVIDVEDDAVTKSRFETEMQNLANTANANDEVLIYMVDHGSQAVTEHFHFETGGDLSDTEMDSLLDGFTCERMTVLVDSCYSGGFISSLDGANRIAVSATSIDDGLNTAKYWAEANPPSVPYAGSWFFHPFWERIDAGDSIQSALDYAITTVPTTTGPYASMTVEVIQDPDMIDWAGDAGTYTFV